MPQSLSNVVIHLIFSNKNLFLRQFDPSDGEGLCSYIDLQEEHHQTKTFQEEFRAFLVKHGVNFEAE